MKINVRKDEEQKQKMEKKEETKDKIENYSPKYSGNSM